MERILGETKAEAEQRGPKTPSPTSGAKARSAKLQRDRDDHSPIEKSPPPPPPAEEQQGESVSGKASAAGMASNDSHAEPPSEAAQWGEDAAQHQTADMDADSPLQLEVDGV